MTAPTVQVLHGDMRDLLPELAAESVHACVTDPPYHLTSSAAGQTGFMNAEWDGGAVSFRADTWKHVYRVLKPGAHLLAMGGTRTMHKLVGAIEDAGFEIRDQISWLYASGLPKSRDMARAIDAEGGGCGLPEHDRIAFATELRQRRAQAGMSRADLAAWFPQYSEVTKNWERFDAGFRIPSEVDYQVLVERLDVSEAWRLRIHAEDKRRKIEGVSVDRRGDGTVYGLAHGGARYEATTDLARQWQGWGTALKPAMELIVVARKPLQRPTVAANVLAHGTGALNIDASRVPGDESTKRPLGKPLNGGQYGGEARRDLESLDRIGGSNAGRWPANVVHSGEPEVLDAFAAFGDRSSRANGNPNEPHRGVNHTATSYGQGDGKQTHDFRDTGTAARFFFCAKANKQDRGDSRHPTVKPLALMRYLCTLVTPPGGMILDPFCGSGTTLQAAMECGFGAVGIERDSDFHADAQRRLARVAPWPDWMAFATDGVG